jgi:hypothetical protein
MRYCPECGTANREGSNFCNNCGADLREVDGDQMVPLSGSEEGLRCGMCGHDNPPGEEVCQRCQARLTPLHVSNDDDAAGGSSAVIFGADMLSEFDEQQDAVSAQWDLDDELVASQPGRWLEGVRQSVGDASFGAIVPQAEEQGEMALDRFSIDESADEASQDAPVADAGLSSWLSDEVPAMAEDALIGQEPTALGEEPAAIEGDGEPAPLPHWLEELVGTEAVVPPSAPVEQAPIEQPVEPESDEYVPSWLQDMIGNEESAGQPGETMVGADALPDMDQPAPFESVFSLDDDAPAESDGQPAPFDSAFSLNSDASAGSEAAPAPLESVFSLDDDALEEGDAKVFPSVAESEMAADSDVVDPTSRFTSAVEPARGEEERPEPDAWELPIEPAGSWGTLPTEFEELEPIQAEAEAAPESEDEVDASLDLSTWATPEPERVEPEGGGIDDSSAWDVAEFAEEGAEAQGIPEWLRDLAPTGQSEVEGGAPSSEPMLAEGDLAVAPEVVSDIPDWLRDLAPARTAEEAPSDEDLARAGGGGERRARGNRWGPSGRIDLARCPALKGVPYGARRRTGRVIRTLCRYSLRGGRATRDHGGRGRGFFVARRRQGCHLYHHCPGRHRAALCRRGPV